MKFLTRLPLQILLLCSAVIACGKMAADERPVAVAATSMIGEMLSSLAGEHLEVRVLIPPHACPGHFDLSPRDAAGLAQAGLVVHHDFQAYLDRKLAAQNPFMQIAALPGRGQLLVPANYLAALSSLNDILKKRFPGQAEFFMENLKTSARAVGEAEKRARERITDIGLAGARVLGSVMQAEFLEWAGLEVCGKFLNSPEELSVRRLKELVATAGERKVEFIAGNLHSGGGDFAEMIAAESGLSFCLLSNFPGTNERNHTYCELLLDNIERLAEARGQARITGGAGGSRTGMPQTQRPGRSKIF